VSDTYSHRIVTAANGTNFVAWVRQAGSFDPSHAIVVRRIGADGMQVATSAIPGLLDDVFDLALVATAGNGAVVVWRQGGTIAWAQCIGADGLPVGDPFSLSAVGETAISSLSVAPGPQGPVAVWESTFAGNNGVRLVRTPASGSPAAPVPVSADNDPTIGQTALGVAPDGAVRVFWQSTGGETEPFLPTTHADPGTAIGTEMELPGGGIFRTVGVAPLPDGRF
jgi:hypothetical protein